jgi:hypothetical protein
VTARADLPASKQKVPALLQARLRYGIVASHVLLPRQARQEKSRATYRFPGHHPPVLTDTHAHLDFPEFRDDVPAILARAAEAGVTRILTIGTGIESSRRAVALAEKWPQVWAVAGVHPNHVPDEQPDFLPTLREIATGSPRRRAQGALLFPGTEWTELRGNVDTRLRKVAEGQADASFLARAGLNRLGIKDWPGLVLEDIGIDRMVPAAGQGAVALQCRSEETGDLAGCLDEATARVDAATDAANAAVAAAAARAYARARGRARSAAACAQKSSP